MLQPHPFIRNGNARLQTYIVTTHITFTMSFFPKVSTSSNTSTQNDNAKIWADRFTSTATSSSSVAQTNFRTSNPQGQIEGEVEYESFLDQTGPPHGEIEEAVGPYSLLNEHFSPDIEFQKSIDGLDVVGLLEVMDTQQIDMEGFMAGRGGEKSLGNEDETEDPVEWLGVGEGYTDDVWGEDDTVSKRGKGKHGDKEEKVAKGKGKGKGKAVDMKSRL
ncbi:hypothetical protein TWF694_003117 [Orbilia ellipsospora]|uniref:Uncharacterized protein n=1 Tax=Orbilia ellipsospora TaxID=2528407 RepID=A0AAV9X6P5_9PEZI